jgi:hypothetical protein
LILLEEVAAEYGKLRKVGFQRDRGATVGASEIGRCARNIVASKLGMPVDEEDKGNGFADRGDCMEDAWIAPVLRLFVEKHGGVLHYSGQGEQVELVSKGAPLSATPDGLATGVNRDIFAQWGVPDIGPSKAVVFEMKSLDPRYGRHKLPKKPHVPQLRQQIGMIRAALDVRPDWGAVFYCDASNYRQWDVYPIQHEDALFRGIVKRGRAIMAAKDWNEFPPEGKQNDGSECRECPRARLCLGYLPGMAGDDPRVPNKQALAKIDKLAAKKKAAENEKDAAAQRERDAEAELYVELSKNKTRFTQGKYTVVAKVPKPQERYSIDLLKERIEHIGALAKRLAKVKKPDERKALLEEITALGHEDCKTFTKQNTKIEVEEAA